MLIFCVFSVLLSCLRCHSRLRCCSLHYFREFYTAAVQIPCHFKRLISIQHILGIRDIGQDSSIFNSLLPLVRWHEFPIVMPHLLVTVKLYALIIIAVVINTYHLLSLFFK